MCITIPQHVLVMTYGNIFHVVCKRIASLAGKPTIFLFPGTKEKGQSHTFLLTK